MSSNIQNLLELPLNRGKRVCSVHMTVLVPGGSTAANLLEPSQTSHEFGVVRLYRTFSNCIFTGGTRCVGTYTLVPGEVSVTDTRWLVTTRP